MMAIVMSFEHWRHYLDGASVEVFSDHQNLRSFMSQTRLNGRQTHWLIKLLPYDFRIFYRKGALNPADGPSRRPDYLADAEEVDDQTPVSQLLPTLSARVVPEEKEPRKQSLRPDMGQNLPNMGMSPPEGANSGSKRQPSQDPGHLPATLRAEVMQADAAKLHKTSVPDCLLDGAGTSEALAVVSGVQEVQAVNNDAKRDLGKLWLQAVTRHQARNSAESLVPGNKKELPGNPGIDLPGLLIELIGKHQEQDPYCKRIAGQLFHTRRQPNLASAQLGPGWDDYTVQQFPGVTKDLLCVMHYVIVPVQTSLCIELLRQFHDYPMAGH
jgi:hypothetical protein